MWFVLK